MSTVIALLEWLTALLEYVDCDERGEQWTPPGSTTNDDTLMFYIIMQQIANSDIEDPCCLCSWNVLFTTT